MVPIRFREGKNNNNAQTAVRIRFVSFDFMFEGVPHATYRDTKLNGYDIPKGTIVFNNLYAVLHEPETFPQPHRFYPGRFLDDDGNVKLSLVERVNAQFGVGEYYSGGTYILTVSGTGYNFPVITIDTGLDI